MPVQFQILELQTCAPYRCFAAIAPGVARGLKLRHDHGSNYMSGDFQDTNGRLHSQATSRNSLLPPRPRAMIAAR
jgi:hypothetical protein